MINSQNSFTLQDKNEARDAIALWREQTFESVDEYTLRKRKAELYSLVRKVIKNELDPRQQEFVRLHWYEGKKITEISLLMDIDKSTAYRMDKKINEIIFDKLKYAIEYRFGKSFSDNAPAIIKQNTAACCPIDGKSISQRLKALRLRQSLNANDVATATGIKPKRLDIIETDGKQITVDELSHLSKLFGTTSDYIIFGRRDNTAGRSDAV